MTDLLGVFVPGRKAAGNSLKRALKWYPLGPSGQKTAPRAYSVRRDGEWPIVAMVVWVRVRRSRELPP